MYRVVVDQLKVYQNDPHNIMKTMLIEILVTRITKVGIILGFCLTFENYYIKEVINTNITQSKTKIGVLIGADHPRRQ